MSKKTAKQAGFTLVEIMLAMAIFTFMLLVVSLAYINIARLYSASTAARNVQQNNRFAMEQMSRVARTANKVTLSNPDSQGSLTSICFGTSDLFYVVNGELRQAKVASCSATPTVYQTLSSPGLSVARMEADTSVTGTVTLRLWMTSRVDLLDTADPGKLACKSGAGSEFCAINKLVTTVELRGE
jgi:prepilin-type N-terminal cleavage/methylation domain-containing protein